MPARRVGDAALARPDAAVVETYCKTGAPRRAEGHAAASPRPTTQVAGPLTSPDLEGRATALAGKIDELLRSAASVVAGKAIFMHTHAVLPEL